MNAKFVPQSDISMECGFGQCYQKAIGWLFDDIDRGGTPVCLLHSSEEVSNVSQH
jgi:hypothetical protein